MSKLNLEGLQDVANKLGSLNPYLTVRQVYPRDIASHNETITNFVTAIENHEYKDIILFIINRMHHVFVLPGQNPGKTDVILNNLLSANTSELENIANSTLMLVDYIVDNDELFSDFTREDFQKLWNSNYIKITKNTTNLFDIVTLALNQSYIKTFPNVLNNIRLDKNLIIKLTKINDRNEALKTHPDKLFILYLLKKLNNIFVIPAENSDDILSHLLNANHNDLNNILSFVLEIENIFCNNIEALENISEQELTQMWTDSFIQMAKSGHEPFDVMGSILKETYLNQLFPHLDSSTDLSRDDELFSSNETQYESYTRFFAVRNEDEQTHTPSSNTHKNK